mgnify:CR=1 FL=1
MLMKAWLKLSHHRHSGRLRPHEHTSYAPLIVLLFVVGVILSAYTVYAATPYTGPEAGSVALNGTVPKKPPTVAATITKPSNGQHFSTSPVEVAGACTKTTLVEIFKNSIFGGSIPCDDTGHYSISVDLLYGKNVLVARVYDVLNQAGPDSNKVTAYYDASAAQGDGLSSLNFSDTQLLLNTDAVFRGTFPGQTMAMPVQILGGTPPYAFNTDWGDSKNSVYSRKNNSNFNATHAYSKPGTYQITVQGTDASGRVAFLTVAAVVNGQVTPVSDISGNSNNAQSSTVVTKLLTLWPLYVALVSIVISFWLGERREKKMLANHGFLVSSQRTF